MAEPWIEKTLVIGAQHVSEKTFRTATSVGEGAYPAVTSSADGRIMIDVAQLLFKDGSWGVEIDGMPNDLITIVDFANSHDCNEVLIIPTFVDCDGLPVLREL